MTNYKATQLINAPQGQLNIWSVWALLQMIETLDWGIRTFCLSAFHKPFVQIRNAFFQVIVREQSKLFNIILSYLVWSRQNSDINLQLLKRLVLNWGCCIPVRCASLFTLMTSITKPMPAK